MCHSERSEESQSRDVIKTSFNGQMLRFAQHDNKKSIKLSTWFFCPPYVKIHP